LHSANVTMGLDCGTGCGPPENRPFLMSYHRVKAKCGTRGAAPRWSAVEEEAIGTAGVGATKLEEEEEDDDNGRGLAVGHVRGGSPRNRLAGEGVHRKAPMIFKPRKGGRQADKCLVAEQGCK